MAECIGDTITVFDRKLLLYSSCIMALKLIKMFLSSAEALRHQIRLIVWGAGWVTSLLINFVLTISQILQKTCIS